MRKKTNNNGIFLGIYHGHNATVAVLDSKGEVLDAISEERFTSKKNYLGFPLQTCKYLLKKYKNREILGVGLPFEYMNSVFLTSTDSIQNSATKVNRLLIFLRRTLLYINRDIHNVIYYIYNNFVGKRLAESQRINTSSILNVSSDLVFCYNHQLCHAYSAYYLSPYNKEDALVLTLDGEGDGLCATVNTVINGEFKTIAETPLGNSLGWIYMNLTEFMGMKPQEHEYKIMGLAPYAKSEYVDEVYSRIEDWITVDGIIFKSKFDTHLALDYMQKELTDVRFDNLAAAFQRLVEVRVTEWVKNCIEATNITTVCCGGGVFMNVKANMQMSKIPSLKNLWVMPSSGDESTTFGAALLAYETYCSKSGLDFSPKPIKHLYLGPSFSSTNIEKFIAKKKLDSKYKIKKYKNIETITAKLLAKGEVVARMSGRMEWGARALGNRSILANPSKPDVIREVNEYIKNRDFWMPFAGSLLLEKSSEYIVNPKNIASDYMIMSFDSTPLAVKHLRAAMHPYDFTIRPQLVNKAWNPKYHKVIREFEKLTGIAGVLNTSFNLHGLPIVLGPSEALHVFENSGIKYLVLEDYLLSK